MSFPHHDQAWTETAEFLQAHAAPGDRILAPDLFHWELPRIDRYEATWRDPAAGYDWVVAHKGELDQLPRDFVTALPDRAEPVFANAVFVVWARRLGEGLERLAETDHLRAFHSRVEELAARPATRPPASGPEHVLPDPAVLQRLDQLDAPAFRAAMDAFWREGGYVYRTLRDRTYAQELDRAIADHAGPCAGEHVLDLCCGRGRLRKLLPRARLVTGIDIAETALRLARADHARLSRFGFTAMDAEALGFQDHSFDTVLLIDASEHIRHIEAALSEAARVLRPGGRLILTAANRDSLHLRLTRRMGLPDFTTNWQHIREFTLEELTGLLRVRGLEVERADGLFLYPWWGVPGIDEKLRPLQDDDPEIVEAIRILGRRAGPDYAYVMMMTARKAAG